MDKRLKKWWLHARLFAAFVVSPAVHPAQINYVMNGSFENVLNFNSPFIEYKAIGWSGVDSTKIVGPLYNIFYGNAPYTDVGYQLPLHGDGFIRLTFYGPGSSIPSLTRSNLKNRLNAPLRNGYSYCAKMYVNMQEHCPKAIDGFGMYFGNESIDTIKYSARLPLTFLSPQVSNPNGNIVNDTANWVSVTGTFVAVGGEKYLIIGNFKSDASTNLAPAVSQYTASHDYSEYFVDKVSCIELDPHFAGRDTTLLPGDSLFIGKTNDDDWIDAKFTWYQPPGSAAITTVTGLWVKPVVTSTYVVKQEICSYTIWDTIVVSINEDDTRLASLKAEHLKMYPLPAFAWLEVSVDVPEWYNGYGKWSVVNSVGQIISEYSVNLTTGSQRLDVSQLPEGVYFLRLSGSGEPPISKRFIIIR